MIIKEEVDMVINQVNISFTISVAKVFLEGEAEDRGSIFSSDKDIPINLPQHFMV